MVDIALHLSQAGRGRAVAGAGGDARSRELRVRRLAAKGARCAAAVLSPALPQIRSSHEQAHQEGGDHRQVRHPVWCLAAQDREEDGGVAALQVLLQLLRQGAPCLRPRAARPSPAAPLAPQPAARARRRQGGRDSGSRCEARCGRVASLSSVAKAPGGRPPPARWPAAALASQSGVVSAGRRSSRLTARTCRTRSSARRLASGSARDARRSWLVAPTCWRASLGRVSSVWVPRAAAAAAAAYSCGREGPRGAARLCTRCGHCNPTPSTVPIHASRLLPPCAGPHRR